MQATRPQSGFTLIEVLLAIGITATVMVTVGSTFHVLLNARDVVDDLTESTEAGPRILNLIERDLRGLWTYNVHNNAVFRGRDMDVNGRDADRMDFLTTTDASGFVLDLQDVPRKPTICEVGYWFKPNPRYRDVFEMWRREDPMVDQELTTQGSFQLVHDRVKSFKVTYYETLGFEAEERLEWDSSAEDKLPKRIKIEFTIERRRSNRNVVNDLEIEDFEGAEKSYVRHFVFDHRLDNILQAGTARIPVLPPEPTAESAGGPGPSGGGGGGGGKTRQTTGSGERPTKVGQPLPAGRTPGQMTSTQGRRPGAQPGSGGLPSGFDLGRFLSGLGGSGSGGGGGGGLFGGH
ncbi:MAG TPA: prepilin-type N-terminal cleavage/methylation domain-containing protein [Planctomycetota bacterium]|nr:prepilin-type N-terminal cleavage/methylation domain-containing protein [Planctomycetota bacterium]